MVECEPDVSRVVPRVGDPFVLLASDGLFDVLSDQEAVDCAGEALQVRIFETSRTLRYLACCEHIGLGRGGQSIWLLISVPSQSYKFPKPGCCC